MLLVLAEPTKLTDVIDLSLLASAVAAAAIRRLMRSAFASSAYRSLGTDYAPCINDRQSGR
jgi:hypothetical protein